MADEYETCDSPACLDLCDVQVVIGIFMYERDLDSARAHADLAHLASAQGTTQHDMARRLLHR